MPLSVWKISIWLQKRFGFHQTINLLRGSIVEAISHRDEQLVLLNLWHPHHAETRMKFQCGCALLISSSRLELQKIEANALSCNQGYLDDADFIAFWKQQL